MAGVTNIIDGKIHEHLARLAAVRIVAGSAADLHVAILGAKQVGGALVQSFPLFHVAAKTGFFYGEARQHLIGQLSVDDFRGFTLRQTRNVSTHTGKQL
jgi:hypothetical protein